MASNNRHLVFVVIYAMGALGLMYLCFWSLEQFIAGSEWIDESFGGAMVSGQRPGWAKALTWIGGIGGIVCTCLTIETFRKWTKGLESSK